MYSNSDDIEGIISSTIDFVKETLKEAESGHDWYHIERVWKTSILISKAEGNQIQNINLLIVQLAALLHDIADHKFHGGDDTKGSKVAREFLSTLHVDENTKEGVCNIISKISFKGSNTKNEMDTLEGKIVQDADRLDAIGAIGIARTFSYGGFRKQAMYDPEDKPKMDMDWEAYKKNKGSTVNHFYEKLLLIKDLMNTDTGKKLAQKRHDYMEEFLDEFYKEWNCEAVDL